MFQNVPEYQPPQISTLLSSSSAKLATDTGNSEGSSRTCSHAYTPRFQTQEYQSKRNTAVVKRAIKAKYDLAKGARMTRN